MAEAIHHALDVNPCGRCAGARRVEERAWRSPAFLVFCQGCGNTEDGESVADAMAQWNTANPARDLDPADVHATAVGVLQPLLTPNFLASLAIAAATYEGTGEADSLDTFMAWCQVQASRQEG